MNFATSLYNHKSDSVTYSVGIVEWADSKNFVGS
jgi:hypothetical protein